MTHTKKILFFGDSLTAGYGLLKPSLESFPALIEDKIEEQALPYKIINAGLSGETTAGGRSRISLLLSQPIDVFVLGLGANDLLRGIPVSNTKDNLQAIIDRVKGSNPGVKMLLLGLEAPAYIADSYAQEFRQVFRTVATTNNMAFVPFLLDGVAGIPDLNLRDGFHPSAGGYKIIAETVWKVLKDLL